MELKIDIDKKDNAVSLDRIIDMVLENAESDPQKQFDYMKQIGCDIIQGYLLGRPVPADDIEQMLIGLL